MRSFAIILAILFSTTSFAQETTAYTKNSSVISAGVGIVNIWKSFLRDAVSYPPSTYKVSATGPFTLIYEYGFTNRISGGVALGYSEVIGNFNGYGEKFEEKLTNFSAILRANFHIGRFKKFDPYIGGGAGYYAFKYTNDRNLSDDGKIPAAFGLSAQAGTKYYVTNSLGLFAELGYVGGSLGQLGFSYKFQH